MTTNSQQSTTEPKKNNPKNKLNKQLEQDSQKWRSHGELSGGKGRGKWGKGTGSKYHKWQVENRQGEVKNSKGNVENK